MMSDLEGLPNMSPDDVPGIPSMPDRAPGPPRKINPIVMILAGCVLILVCGFFLLSVYGLASIGTKTQDEPGYWSQVLGRMFGVEDGGWVAIPSSVGVLLGVALVVFGMVKAVKRRRGSGT